MAQQETSVRKGNGRKGEGYPDQQINKRCGSGTDFLIIEVGMTQDLVGQLSAIGYVSSLTVVNRVNGNSDDKYILGGLSRKAETLPMRKQHLGEEVDD